MELDVNVVGQNVIQVILILLTVLLSELVLFVSISLLIFPPEGCVFVIASRPFVLFIIVSHQRDWIVEPSYLLLDYFVKPIPLLDVVRGRELPKNFLHALS